MLSRMLLGSLPSVNFRIAPLRMKLAEDFFGEGHLAEVIAGATEPPVVVDYVGQFVPDSCTICVGTGTCSLTLPLGPAPFRQRTSHDG